MCVVTFYYLDYPLVRLLLVCMKDDHTFHQHRHWQLSLTPDTNAQNATLYHDRVSYHDSCRRGIAFLPRAVWTLGWESRSIHHRHTCPATSPTHRQQLNVSDSCISDTSTADPPGSSRQDARFSLSRALKSRLWTTVPRIPTAASPLQCKSLALPRVSDA